MTRGDAPLCRHTWRRLPGAGLFGAVSLATELLVAEFLNTQAFPPQRFEKVQRIAAILAQKPRYPTDEAPSREAVARCWIAFEKNARSQKRPTRGLSRLYALPVGYLGFCAGIFFLECTFPGKPSAGSARRPSEARSLREDWTDALRFGLPIRKEGA